MRRRMSSNLAWLIGCSHQGHCSSATCTWGFSARRLADWKIDMRALLRIVLAPNHDRLHANT
jgi:hypothetical protein